MVTLLSFSQPGAPNIPRPRPRARAQRQEKGEDIQGSQDKGKGDTKFLNLSIANLMSSFWLQLFPTWWGRMLLHPHCQNKRNIFHFHDGRNTLRTQKTNGDPLGNRIRAGT